MAESTISLTLDEARDILADYFNWGAGDYSANIDGTGNQQEVIIGRLIKRGLAKFLHPPILQGEKAAHRWSFLTPSTTIVTFPAFSKTVDGTPVKDNGTSTVTLTTADFVAAHVGQVMKFATSGNEYVIASFTSTTVVKVTGDASGETADDGITIDNDDLLLPDNFGGFDSHVTFDSADGYPPIGIVGEAKIRELRQTSTSASRPQFGATRPKTFATATGQRWEFMLWPAPDVAYTLGYRYEALFDVPTTATDYFPGGPYHRETLIQAFLACAEQRREGFMTYHRNRFLEELQSSVMFDRQQGLHESGFNNDLSDDVGRVPRRIELLNVSYDANLNVGRY